MTMFKAHHLIAFFIGMLFTYTSCVTSSTTYEAEGIAIIPSPKKMEQGEGTFVINDKTTLITEHASQAKAVSFLNGIFEQSAGFSLETSSTSSESSSIEFIHEDGFTTGGYRLIVTPDQVKITATDESGFFYAVQTIRQLLPPAIESNKLLGGKSDWHIPSVDIEDEPTFQWRGMHNDLSRHFINIDEVKAFLDYLALYKFNIYHMHLTDDQGWRIEIKEYPLLTEKGAWRIHNNQDTVCMNRAVDNDLFEIDPSNYKVVDGEKMYGGYFTQDQIKEIVAYADARCITVLPEIDMPGHLKSAIDNYPFLSCDGKSGWETVFTYPACLGKPTTYEFLKNVLSEVVELFPSEYIHIGGDEVNIASWEKCPLCQGVIHEHGLKDEHELQSFFNRDIESFLQSKGKKLMGWDEIVEGGLTKDASVMWWRNWRPKAPITSAQQGNDVVVTTTAAYYHDYLNEGVPLEAVYNYDPIPTNLTASEREHILGIQANLWSERIPNFNRLQYQAFPRILAVAENAWHNQPGSDYDNFKSRVDQHYNRLDVLDVYYYIPAVIGLDRGITMVDSTKVELSLAYPADDVDIHYTTDGSIPTRQSPIYESPFIITDSVEIKTIAYKGDLHNDYKSTKVIITTYRNAELNTLKSKGLRRYVINGKFKDEEDLSIDGITQWEAVDSISLSEYKDKKHFNFVYTGYIHAPIDEVYEFETRSDGGDLLYIGEELVVDNGGWHGPRRRHGKVALKQGWHPITIKYRPSNKPRVIEASYAVQGGKLEMLSNEVLRH